MRLPNARREMRGVLLDGDLELTEADIIDLGLDEAPEEAGTSLEEIAMARTGGSGHG